jgi:tetratricopeptide (TPR) repeat protein
MSAIFEAQNHGSVSWSETGAALEHFGSAISANPAYAFAYYNRARVLAASGRQQEAIADLRQCLQLNPDAQFRITIHKRLSELRGINFIAKCFKYMRIAPRTDRVLA